MIDGLRAALRPRGDHRPITLRDRRRVLAGEHAPGPVVLRGDHPAAPDAREPGPLRSPRRGHKLFDTMRPPTKSSGGRANLHQGAMRAPVDPKTGVSSRGRRTHETLKRYPVSSGSRCRAARRSCKSRGALPRSVEALLLGRRHNIDEEKATGAGDRLRPRFGDPEHIGLAVMVRRATEGNDGGGT